jgi:hypothetical protein
VTGVQTCALPICTLLKAVDAQGNAVNYNSAGTFTYTSVSITYLV